MHTKTTYEDLIKACHETTAKFLAQDGQRNFENMLAANAELKVFERLCVLDTTRTNAFYREMNKALKDGESKEVAYNKGMQAYVSVMV